MNQSTHTSRVLRALQDGYAEDAKHQNFEGRRRDSRRIAELNEEFLRWLEEEKTKPAPREAFPEPAEDAVTIVQGHAS